MTTKLPKVSIIGFGYVGSAIAHGFSLHADIKIYDKYKEGFDNFDDVIDHGDFIFICVSTPTQYYLFYPYELEDVFRKITIDPEDHVNKIFIVKSTVIPKTMDYLQKTYPYFNLIYSPEFLTARTAKLDFINSTRIILANSTGSTDIIVKKVIDLFRLRFDYTPIFITDFTTAELVKYACNAFFATKISFFNEINLICNKLGVDYNEVKKLVQADMRIGNSHMDVPGHDGKLGYGGNCLPKDVEALIGEMGEIGLDMDILKSVDKFNKKIRKEE